MAAVKSMKDMLRDVLNEIFDYFPAGHIIPLFYVCKLWYRIIRYRIYCNRQKLSRPFHSYAHLSFFRKAILAMDRKLINWALKSRQFSTLFRSDFSRESWRERREAYRDVFGRLTLHDLRHPSVADKLCVYAASEGNLDAYRWLKYRNKPGCGCRCIVEYLRSIIDAGASLRRISRFLYRQEGYDLIRYHRNSRFVVEILASVLPRMPRANYKIGEGAVTLGELADDYAGKIPRQLFVEQNGGDPSSVYQKGDAYRVPSLADVRAFWRDGGRRRSKTCGNQAWFNHGPVTLADRWSSVQK